MKGGVRYLQLFSLVALLHPLAAAAHPFHWASESIGFVGGLIHPLTGMDHLVIMLATGLWISQIDRAWRIFMPLVFVFFMLIGCGLTLVSVEILYAENFMYFAVLLLILMLTSVCKAPMPVSIFVFGSLALFYGYLHAYDMWLDVDAVEYTAGFAVTTTLMIVTGIVLGLMLKMLAAKSILSRLLER